MRTRSQKLAHENAGGIASPPQQLPAVQKRTRAPRKKTSRTQQEPDLGLEDAKDPNSEATEHSLVPYVHPVQIGSPARSRSIRAPSTSSVAPATQNPTSSAPTTPQAIIHVWVDAAAADLAAAQPVSDPNILLTIPSAMIPNLLNFIATNRTSHQRSELTISAVTTTISISPTSNKRKLPADADSPPVAQRARIEPTPPPVRPKARRAFRRNGLAEVRLDPNMPLTPLSHYEPSDTIPDTKFFKRVDRYGPDGNLQLGLEPVSISSEEGSNALFQPSRPISPPLQNKSVNEENRPATEQPKEMASSDHGAALDVVGENGITGNVSAAPLPLSHASAPETPRGRRWGLGTLMNTARRYIPSLNRRAEPMTPVAEHPVMAPTSLAFSPDVILLPSLTDPKPNNQSAVTAPTTAIDTKSQEQRERRARRQRRKDREQRQPPSPKRGSRTGNRVQSHSKGAQAREDFRREAEMATTPGTKRKRLPSPETIPNPRGCSYGMDLDYFGFDSSDEGDVENTPTKPRPSKSRRISKPGDSDGPMIGDPHNARPYSGVLFAKSGPAYHGGNVFSEVKTTDRALRIASESRTNESQKHAYLSKASSDRGQHAPPATPISNQTGSFKVPEPSDSDSDPGESPQAISLSGTGKSSSKRKDMPSQVEAPKTTITATSTGKSTELWKKSPPPRPTPGHKALPSAPKLKLSEPVSSSSHPTVSSNSGSTSSGPRLPAHNLAPLPVDRSTDSEALRKVREKALQHKPRKPSTLSQSSRLCSSPIGDSGDGVSDSRAQGVAAAQKDTGRNEVAAVQADTRPGGASNVDESPKKTARNEVAATQPGTDEAKYAGCNEVAAFQPDADETQKNTALNKVAAIQSDTNSTGASNVDRDLGDDKQRVSALDRPGPFSAFEEYCQTINPEVASLLARVEVDANVMGVFKAGITGSITDAKGKGPKVAVATTKEGFPLSRADAPTPVNKYVGDPQVVSYINSMWPQADHQPAIAIFEKLLADFVAKEIEEEEANTAAITAGVVV